MKQLVCLLCSSVTYAYKGRDILSRRGIRARVERPAASLGDQGCGYCLTVDAADADRAERIFRDSGVRIIKRIPMGV